MPQTPEERRKTFDALALKRQEMLAQEREKQVVREHEISERTARQKTASLEEQRLVEERGEGREEWRQEQHSKKEAILADARKAEEERVRQETKKAKEGEEDAKRTKKMRELHERAVEQKVASKKLQAEHIEEDAQKNVNVQLDRDLRDAEQLMNRTLEHLVQDRRKKIAQMDDEALRQSKSLLMRFSNKQDSEYKRALMILQDHTVETRAKIEAEYVRLKDEAVAQGEQKKARLHAIADQRLREIHTRHENMDDWIDSHRGVK